MIASLTGTVESCSDSGVVLNVNGIGFDVNMSTEAVRALAACAEGEIVHIHTYMSVGREADVTLFGFMSLDELSLFKRLITVSGIGPKGALSLLSAMSAEDLIFAILSGDAKMISRAPGIGKKTAERLVLELHDKLELTNPSSADGQGELAGRSVETAETGAAAEAVEALTALGYGRGEAAKAVREASRQEGMEQADVQTFLSKALAFLG